MLNVSFFWSDSHESVKPASFITVTFLIANFLAHYIVYQN